MIIGFTKKSSKILSKIICRNFRHCVVIFTPMDTDLNTHLLIQIGLDGVRIIPINESGIQSLADLGFVFIKCECHKKFMTIPNFLTCTGFAKRAIGINNPFIWTPDGLYKYLIKKYRE